MAIGRAHRVAPRGVAMMKQTTLINANGPLHIMVDVRQAVHLRAAKVPAELYEIVYYGALSFGFLLNTADRRGRWFTWSQFADIVEQHYSIENPRTAAVVAAMREMEGRVHVNE